MNVNGFEWQVTRDGDLSHDRVSLKDGTVIVNTSAVSATGLRNLSSVFERESALAFRQLENTAGLANRVLNDHRRLARGHSA